MTDTCSRPRCGNALFRRGLCGRHHESAVSAGIYGYAPSAPVAEHVASLRSVGWSGKAIAASAGVSAYAVNNCGRRPRMWAPVAHAILAVEKVPYISDRIGTPALGSQRRMQALEWMGWEVRDIASRVGIHMTALYNCFNRGSISTAMAARITALFDELADTPGPSRQVSLRARRRGYAPPAAWDGLDMDDPKVKPEGIRRAA